MVLNSLVLHIDMIYLLILIKSILNKNGKQVEIFSLVRILTNFPDSRWSIYYNFKLFEKMRKILFYIDFILFLE